VVAYFSPEAAENYKAAGSRGGLRAYFGVRSAPMGAVSPEVVVATFYNFAPYLVAKAVPSVWETTTPEQLYEARYAGVEATYRRILGDEIVDSDQMAEAAALAREATTALRTEGRPLFAGHATLPWPDAPHSQLFHAQTLLREHRGDGHVAALVLADLDPLEALVTHLGDGDPGQMPLAAVRATRGWTDDDWNAGLDRCRTRGLIDADGACTELGLALREQVEVMTDSAAVAAYQHLGGAKTERLRALVKPWSRAVSDQQFGAAK
jgi:hypothetical protein